MLRHLVLFILIFYSYSPLCATFSNKIQEVIITFSSQFMELSRWNEKYRIERIKDSKFLFDSIDGQLVSTLDETQKKQVIRWMQNLLETEMLKDQFFFYKKMINYLNSYFTIDELKKLNRYYKTDLMQQTVQASIDGNVMETEHFEKMLSNNNNNDKDIIDDFTNSYLSKRYNRFLETVNQEITKQIYLRTKEALEEIMKLVPSLVNYAKDGQKVINLNLNLPPITEPNDNS